MHPLEDVHQGFAVPPERTRTSSSQKAKEPRNRHAKKSETWKVGKLESQETNHPTRYALTPTRLPLPPHRQHNDMTALCSECTMHSLQSAITHLPLRARL